VKKRSLHAGLRQEQLSHAQTAFDRTRDSRGKHERARATAEAGGLGVDIRDVSGVRLERR
jgi:hypothetical protein